MIFYLIGMMGSGKSSVGKLLANKLQFSIIDIDKEIEKNEKLSIKEIFEEKGENYFREIESKYLLRKRNSAVVSCGGGIILNKKNRECGLLTNTSDQLRVMYLSASHSVHDVIETTTQRVSADLLAFLVF